MNLNQYFLSKRILRKAVTPFLPEMAILHLDGNFKLAVDPSDMTGPSYYVMNDGAEAFYHYALEEKGEVASALGSDEPVMIDIGANIGLFSFFISRLAPRTRIIAFEPHPTLARCIQKTIDLNQLKNVEVHALALSSESGTAELLIHEKNSGGHSLSKLGIGAHEIKGKTTIQKTTLDLFFSKSGYPKNIDTIKIDVQGFEMFVLAGASETLKRFTPKLVLEIDIAALDGNWNWFNDFFNTHAIPYRKWKAIGAKEWESLSSLPHFLSNASKEKGSQVMLAMKA